MAASNCFASGFSTLLISLDFVVILRRRKYNKTLANTNAGADVSKA